MSASNLLSPNSSFISKNKQTDNDFIPNFNHDPSIQRLGVGQVRLKGMFNNNDNNSEGEMTAKHIKGIYSMQNSPRSGMEQTANPIKINK